MNIRERIESLLKEMGKGAYEREEVLALALLSAVAGESIFLLGLPGVGKSMVARRLKMAFKGSRSFEYLMSRFSTPDEIFGPVSISKLKDHDLYERVIDGYLPTADVVFLDEIWKAGPAIQNSLLTVLNEKIFRNGTNDIRLPLKAVISASNELPAEGEGLEALWDRFLIRYIVKPITSKQLFLTLLCGNTEDCTIQDSLQITETELNELKSRIEDISVPNHILETVYSIRAALIEERKRQKEGVDVTKSDLVEPPYVSDRRWKKIMGILKASALLNGRKAVDYTDCLLMNHMLWDKDEQINSVKRLVAEAIANAIRQNGLPGIVGRTENKKYTKPVGEPICPDGIHYIFLVGDEEVMIEKSAYENLSLTKASYGVMTTDNKLVLSDKPTSLAVRKTIDGMCVNSFSYPLKRDSTLRSGSVEEMLEDVSNSIDTFEGKLKSMVNDNLFLPSYTHFTAFHNAFRHTKNQMMGKSLW